MMKRRVSAAASRMMASVQLGNDPDGICGRFGIRRLESAADRRIAELGRTVREVGSR
jgi:hypothetical protein